MTSAAFYSRLTRSNLMETMGEDYIRTARAKGMPERRVIGKHGLRSALTPLVTMFGLDFAFLLGGADHHRERLRAARARAIRDRGYLHR